MIITRRWCYIIWSRKWHNLPSQTFMWTVWSLDMHSGQSWGISYFGNTPLWQHYLTYRASKILFIFHFPVIPGSYHGEKKEKRGGVSFVEENVEPTCDLWCCFVTWNVWNLASSVTLKLVWGMEDWEVTNWEILGKLYHKKEYLDSWFTNRRIRGTSI